MRLAGRAFGHTGMVVGEADESRDSEWGREVLREVARLMVGSVGEGMRGVGAPVDGGSSRSGGGLKMCAGVGEVGGCAIVEVG